MNNKIKICGISDLHGNFPKHIEKCDILTISGDISPSNCHNPIFQRKWLNNNFIPWCKALIDKNIVKYVVFCAGNHDFIFEELMNKKEEMFFRNELPANIHYLRDDMITIEGIKIYGTPWSPTFGRWSYMKKEDELDEIYSKIPEGVDIIISHSPPFGYGDQILQSRNNPWSGGLDTPDMRHLGSKALIKHIDRVKPIWCFLGHIHSGEHKITKRIVDEHIINFVNVSILDEEYKIFYTPFYSYF
jgi:Icc-related predicted phosphoesterase